MPLFPGKDWLKAYVCQINLSKAYAECAVNWEGDVTFLFEAEPLTPARPHLLLARPLAREVPGCPL